MTSNAKAKVLFVLDIILRVPPLFLMDSILHKSHPYTLGPPNVHMTDHIHGHFNVTQLEVDQTDWITMKYQNLKSLVIDLNALPMLVLGTAAFILALAVFMLSREHLLLVYKWLFAVSTIYISYWSNVHYIEHAATYPFEEPTIFLLHFLLQLILTVTFCMAHNQHKQEGIIIAAAYLLPSMFNATTLFPHPRHFALASALVTLTYVKFICLFKVPIIVKKMVSAFRVTRMFIRYYGLHALLENEWTRMNVPHVLRVFWLVRISEDLVFLVADKLQFSIDTIELSKLMTLSMSSLSSLTRELLVRGCDTLLAVLGMTSMVAALAHYIGYAIQQFLMTDDDEEKSIGTVSAVLFFILALQTGLTGLEPEKRLIRLYRNFCLLFTAMLHFIHNIVNPLLMTLSASRNPSVQKHGRVLSICGILIAFPCWFLYYLWAHHSVSTWMLAVSAFTIEVIVKVVISLLVYFLFIIDAYRNDFWEKLDDYIYYIRATGNTIEFTFGIFLFFNGAWILLFESGGAIRACMMCIHAYVNIWLQAKAGWVTFIKRRTAVNKINLLPEATEEQLQKFDDVCAICYQDLTTARITKCNHYFHSVCLRKWLYVQDRCPLCHNTLYRLDSDVDVTSANSNREELNDLIADVNNEPLDDGETALRHRERLDE
uniref:RING-type domain-containing protein n=1 Tax=Strigamia maritima TaxID=126957 RepID=T1IZP5_STRMM